jgi:phage terminase large subunit-like protein
VRAAADPAAFVRYCFADPAGRPLRMGAVHHELQAFLSAHPKALVELPRDHGKSTQVCGRIVWELGRRPGLRVVLVCGTDALAAARGRFVRDAIAANPRVRDVFPHLVPGRPWAAERFSVARPADAIGPSVTAVGLGTGTTGSRADLLVCDDVVDVRAVHSRAERERADDYFRNNLLNLLEPDGRFWGLFTPWHADDLNARLAKNPAFAHFRRAVGPDLEPVWPERWPREALAGRRAEIGSAAFARGYRLTPIAEEEVLVRPEWVRTWAGDGATPDAVALSVDPAVSAKASADASALVLLARVGREVRVLASAAKRAAAPELVTLLDEWDRAWTPDVILFESNAAFAAVRDLLVRHARFGAKVKGVVQSRAKAARVAAFAVAVEGGAFRLKADGAGGIDAGQRGLFEEVTTFPFGEHDDLLDAAATGTSYLLSGSGDPRVWG